MLIRAHKRPAVLLVALVLAGCGGAPASEPPLTMPPQSESSQCQESENVECVPQLRDEPDAPDDYPLGY